VYPALGDRPIASIRRVDITRVLNQIERQSGAVMADRVLATIRRILNWRAVGDDTYSSPIVTGMARTDPGARARKRVLDEAELRAVWAAADKGEGPFHRLVQFLLLTGARRNEAAQMKRAELSGGDWTLPAARNKTGDELMRPLSAAAQAILARLPEIEGCPYVFTTDGRHPVSGFSRFKRAFDEACGVTGWTLHDLRRTARSLMSRAGVNSDHAERALGHVIGGVRGVYDRHPYQHEMLQAFEALAALIERIINPPSANVIPLHKG
jgi:integrase